MSNSDSPDEGNPNRQRMIVLIIALIVGLAVASIPVVISLTTSGPENSAATNEQQSPAGANNSTDDAGSNDTGASDTGLSNIAIDHPRACPEPDQNSANQLADDAELRGIELPCLTDPKNGNSTQDLGKSLAGKPTIINVWAWWCEPCRRELPLFDDIAKNHPEWNVVGIHLDPKAQAGADFLDDLGTTSLPTFEDSNHTFDSYTAIPKVVPITLVYYPDGTRAKMHAKTFRDESEIVESIREALG